MRNKLKSLIIQAEGKGVEIICFPELSITAYTCGDLFAQQLLLDEAEMCLISILDFTRSLDIISIIGLPVAYHGTLLNCAAVIQKRKNFRLIPKTYLPNYKEFYEQRWFTSGDVHGNSNVLVCGQMVPLSRHLVFNTPLAVSVWKSAKTYGPPSPQFRIGTQGAEIIFNLSADNEGVGKQDYLKSLLAQQSARCLAGYVFSGAGFGESTQMLFLPARPLSTKTGCCWRKTNVSL